MVLLIYRKKQQKQKPKTIGGIDEMRKKQLERIWKQLDGMCEALEQLQENDIDTHGIDFSAVVLLKNDVEEMIEKKSRKAFEGMK